MRNDAEALAARSEAHIVLEEYQAALTLTLRLMELKAGPESADLLRRIMREDPRLKARDTFREPDVAAADRYYMIGRRHYFAGAYPAAEESFRAAVKEDDADARYHYFLGLARLAQGKKEGAEAAFDKGAALEAQGLPPRRDVNAALEPIQGALRRRLNDEREKPH